MNLIRKIFQLSSVRMSGLALLSLSMLLLVPMTKADELGPCLVEFGKEVKIGSNGASSSIRITAPSSAVLDEYKVLEWTTSKTVLAMWWGGSFTQEGDKVTFNIIRYNSGVTHATGMVVSGAGTENNNISDVKIDGIACSYKQLDTSPHYNFSLKEYTSPERFCESTTAELASMYEGYTGNGYLEFVDKDYPRLDSPRVSNTGSSIKELYIRIRYANGSDHSISTKAFVRSQGEEQIVEFPSTGSWSNWGEIYITNFAGASTLLSLVGTRGQDMPLIDSITTAWSQNCIYDCFRGGVGLAPGNHDGGIFCPIDPLPGAPETINHAPIAVVSVSDSSGSAPLKLAFYSENSRDPDGDELSYSWDFGDGRFGSGEFLEHSYLEAGVYTAILTVSDGKLSDQASIEITVLPPPTAKNISCHADLSAWHSGFVATISIKNDGDFEPDTISGVVTFSGAVKVNSAWVSRISSEDSSVEVPFVLDAALPAGQIQYFGFWGEHDESELNVVDCIVN